MKVPRRVGLSLPNYTTWMYEGVVEHAQGGEGFACKVRDPIMEIVVTSPYDEALVKVQGNTDGKFGIAAVTAER